MTEGIQAKLDNIGNTGCYFLTLLNHCNVPDYLVLEYYKTFLKDGYIDAQCTVLRPDLIMKSLNGKRYRVVKSDTFDDKADIIIGYWYNPRTKFHHFVEHNKRDEVIWDSYGQSLTVKEGHVESYRLYYEVK